MEGRYPKGIYWALNELTDPSREDQFNAWYHRYQIPQFTRSGVFTDTTRFISPPAREGEGYSLVIYEIRGDPLEAWDSLGGARRATGEMAPADPHDPKVFAARRSLGTGVYRKIGGEYRARYNRPVRGVYCTVANCDPEREDAMNAFYEDMHIMDILDSGMFHTAYRYQCIDMDRLNGPGGKYITIWETDIDPWQAVEALAAFRPKWREAGRIFDGIQMVRRFIGKRVWPAD